MFVNAHTAGRGRPKYGSCSQTRTQPMDRQELVTVYRYQYWDIDAVQLLTSQWEATLDCIRSGLGNPIIESGRQVPASEVDAFGRHFALPMQPSISPREQ